MQKHVTYIKSAVYPQDYPEHRFVEIAVVGRSNAGKSSLINLLCGGKIAKVSSQPGKTRLLNFFNFGNKYVLVDMPGYGFASRSGDEVVSWQKMIESYFHSRNHLKGLLLVIDIRREWTEDEEMLKRFSHELGFPLAIALTKADKMSRSQMLQAVAKMKKQSGLSDVFALSTLQKIGHKEIEDHFYENWVKGAKVEVNRES